MTVSNLIIAFNMLCVRLAILGLYHRIFNIYETSRKLICAGYFISVIIALPEMCNVIARMVECSSPIVAITVSYCNTRNSSISIVTFSILGVLADVFIYSIAIVRLRSLQVKRSKKIQLAVVFAVVFAVGFL
jgi:hypothetical protein